jgi:hypothetical protein
MDRRRPACIMGRGRPVRIPKRIILALIRWFSSLNKQCIALPREEFIEPGKGE